MNISDSYSQLLNRHLKLGYRNPKLWLTQIGKSLNQGARLAAVFFYGALLSVNLALALPSAFIPQLLEPLFTAPLALQIEAIGFLTLYLWPITSLVAFFTGENVFKLHAYHSAKTEQDYLQRNPC